MRVINNEQTRRKLRRLSGGDYEPTRRKQKAAPGSYSIRTTQPRRIPSIQPVAANQGAGFGERWEKYNTHQTPTKNIFFQSTVPVFGISTREMPVNTKKNFGFFDETSRIQAAKKNGRQLGFKWRLMFSSLFSEVRSHKTQVLFGVLA